MTSQTMTEKKASTNQKLQTRPKLTIYGKKGGVHVRLLQYPHGNCAAGQSESRAQTAGDLRRLLLHPGTFIHLSPSVAR